MKKLKVLEISNEYILFENDIRLYSAHDQDCCENHYLNLDDLSMHDFDGLEFDLTNDNFFNRIPDYGIELMPINGHSIRIAGYGYNNGYYSENLSLIIDKEGRIIKEYNIQECQLIQYE